MKLLVAGSRSITDEYAVIKILAPHRENISLLITGGAKGVDQLAENWADYWHIPTKIIEPAWRDMFGNYDPQAGHKRNSEMLKMCDKVIVIWDGESAGTLDTISKAIDSQIDIEIYFRDSDEKE